MRKPLPVTGIVLKTEPIGEYDRRVVLLTLERGKISAFARGAGKPGSRLLAATVPFCYGQFDLYVGRSSYTLASARISNYFEDLRRDYEAVYYGMYFLEIAEYCTRENNDEIKMLSLLYQSLKALTAPGLKHQLVRAVYEIKTVVVNGEFPGIPEHPHWQESTVRAVEYVERTPVEKVYTFSVSPGVLTELCRLAGEYLDRFAQKDFKSREVLSMLAQAT